MTTEAEQRDQYEKAAEKAVEEAEESTGPGAAYLRGHLLYAIAMICHEANRAYCHTIGQEAIPWERASQEQKMTVVMGVSAIVDRRVLRPRDSHDHWLMSKHALGWKYGEKKDEVEKTHPCMVEFNDLPEDDQRKDMIFFGLVVALLADPHQFGSVPPLTG